MTQLSLVMPYYRNPGMLSFQYECWSSWPEALKRELQVVIVDDGSPEPADDVERPIGLPSLSIYRVLEDRPWHQHGARNLGAHVAKSKWLLLTDMDHVLSESQFQSLLSSLDELNTEAIYTLDRVEADTGLPTFQNGREKPHPNSFVVTRDTYWKIGGYDEDFCGIYGTDALFRSRAESRMRHLSGVALTRYWRDLIADASTTTLERKEGRDPKAKMRVLMEKAARGESKSIKLLDFAWKQVL